jgi:nitrite reductase (cytochrome c-552)
MGFHAPQECARVLNKALKFASDGRLEVQRIRAKLGKLDPVSFPDISTKELAQSYIKPFVDKQKAAAKAKEEAEKQAATAKK